MQNEAPAEQLEGVVMKEWKPITPAGEVTPMKSSMHEDQVFTLRCAPVESYAVEDCAVTRIEATQQSVQFVFQGGVWDSAAQARMVLPARLLVQCSEEDVLITEYREHRFMRQNWGTVRYPSIGELASALEREQFEIEIIMCLSSDHRLFLKGVWKNCVCEFDLMNVQAACMTFQHD